MNSKRTKMVHKNKQKTKRFSQSVPTLLTEIIIEILLKLPVESLLRCKSVCKQWYSLISDKHFIKTHYSLSSTNNNFAHLVFFSGSYHFEKLKSCPLNDVLLDNSVNNALEHPFKRSTSFHYSDCIVGSCNGLLCIVFERTIFIYNPSTRILNRLYGGSDHGYFVFGFGYDEFNDDYKVVSILFCGKKVKIYSLKTGKWKNICDFPNYYVSMVCGIFSNGALHWVETNPYLGSSNKWKIHFLDLAKETYDEVLQPEYDEGVMHLELGALGPSLCVLCNYSNSHADLWIMKVYGVKESWTKLASIPCDPLRDQFSHQYDLIFSGPLCISNDGKVLLQFGGRNSAGKYVIFDSKNISFTLVKEIEAYPEACTIVESLVPPNYALGICNRLRSSRVSLRLSGSGPSVGENTLI